MGRIGLKKCVNYAKPNPLPASADVIVGDVPALRPENKFPEFGQRADSVWIY
jgi:hypothetical protein